jgi:16S rRNA C967 or C1407 C5-methylase (RsmB/RsmF family)
MGKRNRISGEEAFETYYQNQFGPRWPALKASLLEERKPVSFETGLTTPYFLDEASILAATTLAVAEGDAVLDMCAAPGGKTLVLLSMLHGKGSLVANDRSSARRNRLVSVLKEHLSPSMLSLVTVTSHDSTKWGLYEQEAYDRILLDAPCSSERHVLTDPAALSLWSPARPRHLAIEQFAMLASALEAVKVGGHVLYSTCALTSEEDEEVIAKLFKKRSGRFAIEETDVNEAEKRQYGQIVLPDTAHGKGPLYFCLLRRIS